MLLLLDDWSWQTDSLFLFLYLFVLLFWGLNLALGRFFGIDKILEWTIAFLILVWVQNWVWHGTEYLNLRNEQHPVFQRTKISNALGLVCVERSYSYSVSSLIVRLVGAIGFAVFRVGLFIQGHVWRDTSCWWWFYETEAQSRVCFEWWWYWWWCLLEGSISHAYSCKKADMDWDCWKCSLDCFGCFHCVLRWSAFQSYPPFVSWWAYQKVIFCYGIMLLTSGIRSRKRKLIKCLNLVDCIIFGWQYFLNFVCLLRC